jgi:hypothetical protein
MEKKSGHSKCARLNENWKGTRSERCASVPKVMDSNPSGGSKSTFRSDLLLTARGGSTWALIEFACLPCYPGNTLLSAPRAARKGWVGTKQIPPFFFFLNY